MIKMNIKKLKLKEVIQINNNNLIFQLFYSEKIIKVFHDCLEDLSLISSVGEFSKFNSIFDTQIAHRMCYNDENNCNSIGTKNISISLKELLKYYFNYNQDLKDEIHQLMSSKPYLWKTRPLTDKLIHYAGSDVIYLPKVYDVICVKCSKRIYKNVTIEKILEESKKYLKYLDINKDIKNYDRINLKKGAKLLGLIKNFQHRCVFVQLNIGYIGIVSDINSISFLKIKYNLGDIIEFKILEIENDKKRLILDIYNKPKEKSYGEEEEKNKIETNAKHEKLNVNKKSFYPKSYLNRYRNLSQPNLFNNINNINNFNSININNNRFNYNSINNFNGNDYHNSINNPNQINDYYYNIPNINSNNGWIYNGDNNAFYFEQPDGNKSSNFYYVINRFQESNQSKYGRHYK